MAKNAPALLEDPPPVRLTRRFRGVIVLGLFLSVPIFEEAKVIVARWMTILGHPTQVRTPVLDVLALWSRRLWASVAARTTPLFREPAWEFGPTILVSTMWMLALLMLLRSIRR
ncbi:MAG TPA: hypothetical protein VFT74_05315 [Isosphaeraceae bacterium]|nr:hypothetical protein [Isosphaeraceae bacterium]